MQWPECSYTMHESGPLLGSSLLLVRWPPRHSLMQTLLHSPSSIGSGHPLPLFPLSQHLDRLRR